MFMLWILAIVTWNIRKKMGFNLRDVSIATSLSLTKSWWQIVWGGKPRKTYNEVQISSFAQI